MRNAAIDVAAARRLGIMVCGTGSRAGGPLELTWGLVLAVARAIPAEDRNVRDGGWQRTVGVQLAGRTLGVVGLGRIGSEVARVGRAFGMRVVAWSQNLTAERAAATGAELVSKPDLLRSSDVVTIHLALSSRTRGIIGAADLALLKPSAILVNTARGPIVDEAALVDTLARRRIAGAGLDVFDVEPLPAEHPLRRLDNVVLTPHVGYVTEETYRVFYGEALEDVLAFSAGAPIRVLDA
jgi:phosphoglycerate dehydrogenase-like enzyme